jgi:hypothetical protein
MYRFLIPSILACLFALVSALALSAAEFDDRAAALRASMAQRDLLAAKEKLAELKVAAKSEAEQATAERLDLLSGYLFDFWKSVDEGGRTLRGTDELVISGKRVAVVEYDAAQSLLILRVEGQNKRYTLRQMPPRVALTLAERVLKPGAPQNEVFFGTFLAMDGKGDRKLAREAWEKAARGGIDVKHLLPELQVPLPGGATIELPVLNVQTAALLKPAQWQVATRYGGKWKRSPLAKDQAAQNTLGRLELHLADDANDAFVTFAKKMPAGFGLRMYLVDVPVGQRFGLLSDSGEHSLDASVALPSGLVKIEFARQAGKFLCRINDAETEVTIADEKSAKTADWLGFSLPAGGKVVMAGCEFAR